MSLTAVSMLAGACAIACWLVAGVFLAFSDFIMRSLAAIPAAQGIAAMQSVNLVVYRSIFLTSLLALGAASLLFIALGLFGDGVPSGLFITAGAIYLVAVMVVTIAGNVPLNNRLAAVDPNTTEAAQLWARYLKTWTRWNHVRTVGSTLTAALLTVAAFHAG